MITELIGTQIDTLAENLLQLNDAKYSSIDHLSIYREQGKLALSGLEFPAQNMEAWKYTAVKPQFEGKFSIPGNLLSSHAADLILNKFQAKAEDQVENEYQTTSELQRRRIILINGSYEPSLSDSMIGTGIKIISFEEAVKNGEYQFDKTGTDVSQNGKNQAGKDVDFFTLFNQAGAGRGIVVSVDKDAIPDFVLHIEHVFDHSEPALIQTRNIFNLGINSVLTILETTTHINSNVRSIHNAYTEINVSARAKGDHILIQKGNAHTSVITRENINLSRDSNFSMHTYTLAGKFTRNNLKISLNESGAEGHMFGFYQLNGSELCDNHTLADHKAPHCMSNEHYKGTLKGKSIGVFNGKVFVHPDAQKTNAYQQNNSIILEDEASMNSKPELEIYADDVKCSHGSTIGQLDESSMFYLKSRGIGESLAREMLIRAFADEIISKLRNEVLINYLEKEIA